MVCVYTHNLMQTPDAVCKKLKISMVAIAYGSYSHKLSNSRKSSIIKEIPNGKSV